MRTKTKNLNQTYQTLLCALCTVVYISATDAASVVSRTQRPAHASSRMPTMTTHIESGTTSESGTNTATADTESAQETETPPKSEPTIPGMEPEIIEDKTSVFDSIVSTTNTDTNESNTILAQQIAAQRAALDAASEIQSVSTQTMVSVSSGQNACDVNLRACMKSKCGNDFSKCALDTDTTWGDKMDSCRRDLPCSGTEYRLFATEIKADRDTNARLSSYNAVVDCGNRYNNCIINECGTTFSNCLGKGTGDTAVSKCANIARECTEMDSGLASRAMNVFASMRIDAEKQIARDEKRLYELRDAMASTCKRLGAMFDERTLDCVYTVNFYAGDDNTLYASKKAYAGSTFSCDQNWFGVDITTFRENAYRLTREQKSATSALLGSGIGMGVGAITSGAIDRAIDRHTAEKAVKDAEQEHNELYGDNESDKADKNNKGKKDKDSNTAESKSDTSKSDKHTARQEKRTQQRVENKLEKANQEIIQSQSTETTSDEKIEIPDLSEFEEEAMEFEITPVETQDKSN